MYCIKINVNNTFLISKIQYNDIFENKELSSPFYKNYHNITMSSNLITPNTKLNINSLATKLFNCGVVYGDILIMINNKEDNMNSYIELLSEIIKDVSMSNSKKETLEKYKDIFNDDATTSDDETRDTDEEETEQEINERNKKLKFVKDYLKSRSITNNNETDEEENINLSYRRTEEETNEYFHLLLNT